MIATNLPNFSVVIPARLTSTRLPKKPLADIAGKPMVVRVAEQAQHSAAQQIIVATDHPDIVAACEQYGIRVQLTRADHPSGTDRLAEIVQLNAFHDDSLIVNVQGDEPLIAPEHINLAAQCLAQHPEAAIATLAHPIHQLADWQNPNIVKVVCDAQHYALYFSRAPIPLPRDTAPHALPEKFQALRHIGLYAYRAKFLRQYTQLAPAPLESIEALEQLRAMWHGYRIAVATLDSSPHAGVDTPEDLTRVRALFHSTPHDNK